MSDDEGDTITISSDEETQAALMCVNLKEGEPFRLQLRFVELTQVIWIGEISSPHCIVETNSPLNAKNRSRDLNETLNGLNQINSITQGTESAPKNTCGNSVGYTHYGVKCDNCDGDVRGFRYKCLQCADFDLCGQCETLGAHPGHTMIRVASALVSRLGQFFFQLFLLDYSVSIIALIEIQNYLHSYWVDLGLTIRVALKIQRNLLMKWIRENRCWKIHK